MARPGGANYVIILKHETLSGKRKSGEEHRRNSLLRHSLIAAAFALATIRLRGSQATRHLRTSTAIRTAARSCTTSTPTHRHRALLSGPVSCARLSSSVCFGGANHRSTWRRSVPRLLFDWRLLISHHQSCRVSGPVRGSLAGSVVPTARELVEGDRCGVGGVERRLRRAGRHARAKIAALAHQPAYAATL
jgi:hypothetical protein